MATLHAYLNFPGNCEEAFAFYSKVFNRPTTGTYRYSDMPADPAMPPLSDEIRNKIMNIGLFVNDQVTLMGSDFIEEFCGGAQLVKGNNTYLNLAPETASEAKTLFDSLTQGNSRIEMPLGEQFWAELYASFQDQFGISWMINFEGNKKQS